MGWWSRAKAAVSRAVSKATSAVRRVVSKVTSSVSRTVSKAKTSVSKAVSKVTSSVSKSVSRASSSVSRASSSASRATSSSVTQAVAQAVSKVSVVVKTIKDTATKAVSQIKEKLEVTTKKVEEEKIVAEKRKPSWQEELVNRFTAAVKTKGLKIGTPIIDLIPQVYSLVTGKEVDAAESIKLKAKAIDYVLPLNALSKLFLKKDLDGKPAEFGTGTDWTDLAFASLMFIPAAKLGSVAAKLGSKGITQLFAKNADEAIKLIKVLKPDEQAKVIKGLDKSEDVVKVLEKIGIKDIAKYSAKDIAKLARTLGVDGFKNLYSKNPAIATKVFLRMSGSLREKIITSLAKTSGGRKILTTLATQKALPIKNTGNVIKNLVAQAKKNPLIALFAATEIPQIAVLSIFAFKWMAQQQGKDLTGVSIALSNLYKSFDSAGYDFRDAVKNEDWVEATRILTSIKNIATEYNSMLRTKRDVLEKAGEYDARFSVGDLMTVTASKMETKITPHIEEIKREVPEAFKAKVREIIDGDSIKVRDDVLEVTREVRLVGINTPERGEIGNKEAKEWLAKQIYGKEVEIKVDPAHVRDQHDRVLGTIYSDGKNINLESITKGWAFNYPYEENKYMDKITYAMEEAEAKQFKRGMWGLLVEKGSIGVSSSPTHAKIFLDDVDTGLRTAETIKDVEVGVHTIRLELEGYPSRSESIEVKADKKVEVYYKWEKEKEEVEEEEERRKEEEERIIFSINSMPEEAKVYIDEVYTGHLTPTDEKEQSDKISLWSEGSHKIRIIKGGYVAEEDINLVRGSRLILNLDLLGGLPEVEVPVEVEVPPEEEVPPEVPIVAPPVLLPVSMELIPPKYATEQEWALKIAFERIWALTKGAEVMSDVERENLILEFNMHTDKQKEVLNLLWQDLEYHTKGAAALSTSEFKELKTKYRIVG